MMPDPTEKSTDVAVPIQPTGFGVADLEIAREQDALANDEPIATDDDLAADDGEGHPS